jgi:hypothetical protein
MQIDGRCHCGHVSYVAEIDPDDISICHCTDCQQLTGTAFRVSATTTRDKVRMTGEEPRVYEKRGDNGRRRFQYFCPMCGSPILTHGEGEDAEECALRWGSIRQRANLVPSRQIWCRSMVPWIDEVTRLPGAPED